MANAFDRCITAAIQAKRITQARADELRDELDRFVQAGLTPDETKRASLAYDALNTLEFDILRRKANALRQARADRWNVAESTSHAVSPSHGVDAKLVPDRTGYAGYGNVETQGRVLAKRWQGRVSDAIAAMRAKGLFGHKQDFVLAEMTGLELRGKDTGNATAKAFAKSLGDVFEEIRLAFNRAGGSIRSRGDWGFPQVHDAAAVARAGLDKWRTAIRPLLDPAKMLRPDGTPMQAADLDDVLEHAFKSITGTTVARRSAAVGNLHTAHRVLVFKDADSWLSYNRQYGEADILGGWVRHIDGMAQEIGAMQILGPDPEAGVLALQQALADHLSVAQPKPLQAWLRSKGWNTPNGEAAVRRVEALWHTVRGGSVMPSTVVQMSQAVRQLNIWKLGSATISSISDEATMMSTARWNGIRPVRVMREELAQMTREDHRIFALRAGIGWDSWTRAGVASNRFGEEAVGRGYVATIGEGIMRASGLNYMTDARRAAFGMEFLGALGDASTSVWGDLGDGLRRALQRYGIDQAEWDIMRSAGVVDFDGARYLHPEQLLAAGVPTRNVDALVRMVLTETDYAVPTPGAYERFLVSGGHRNGTGTAEVFKHLFQFKTFPITMMSKHLTRGLYQQGLGDKAAYLARLGITLTGAGAVVLQARSLLQGRDPEDMDDLTFWGRAFVQGGGAGLIGDFLATGITGANRFGNSFVSSMLGPSAGLAEDLARVTFPTLQGDMSAKSFVDVATRHLMPGSSLWYARLMMERTVKDQINIVADPAAARRSFRSREKFYAERGSDYWWEQGQLLPGE